jgi:hypothetical protein
VQGSDLPSPAKLGELLEKIGLSDSTPVSELPPERMERLEGDDLEQLIKLKRFYGIAILIMMAVQLVVVNVGFGLYAALGYDWAPPYQVVQVWLAATFVQIVSVVVVITKSLFPPEKSELAKVVKRLDKRSSVK